MGTTIKLSPVLIISEYCYKILAVESCVPGLFFMIFNTFRGKFVQFFCHHCWLYTNRNKKPKLSCISHMITSGLNNKNPSAPCMIEFLTENVDFLKEIKLFHH